MVLIISPVTGFGQGPSVTLSQSCASTHDTWAWWHRRKTSKQGAGRLHVAGRHDGSRLALRSSPRRKDWPPNDLRPPPNNASPTRVRWERRFRCSYGCASPAALDSPSSPDRCKGWKARKGLNFQHWLCGGLGKSPSGASTAVSNV